ncbi:MAG: putative nucleic acid-binding protein contains PIN [Planctomycetota bacterium]|nr:MAG: putative nucleic acid-binding protein contains PIN [Planctomycetota bacterium]
MILVDTSVWIEIFRARNPLAIESVVEFEEIVTCLPVVQEVLQGFQDERAFRVARESFLALPIVESPVTAGLVEEAAGLYRAARRQGVTVRSSVDCLIAACALRHQLTVLHRDRDFQLLAQVSPLHQRNL